MEISDVRAEEVVDVKLKINDDMSALLVLEMIDGDSNVIKCSAEEGQEFKENWKEQYASMEKEVLTPPPPKTCEICGNVHEIGKPIFCICVKCHQKKEIVDMGCCKSCYGEMTGIYDRMMETNNEEQSAPTELPWEK